MLLIYMNKLEVLKHIPKLIEIKYEDVFNTKKKKKKQSKSRKEITVNYSDNK
jgi:hypothetical protein